MSPTATHTQADNQQDPSELWSDNAHTGCSGGRVCVHVSLCEATSLSWGLITRLTWPSRDECTAWPNWGRSCNWKFSTPPSRDHHHQHQVRCGHQQAPCSLISALRCPLMEPFQSAIYISASRRGRRARRCADTGCSANLANRCCSKWVALDEALMLHTFSFLNGGQ